MTRPDSFIRSSSDSDLSRLAFVHCPTGLADTITSVIVAKSMYACGSLGTIHSLGSLHAHYSFTQQ